MKTRFLANSATAEVLRIDSSYFSGLPDSVLEHQLKEQAQALGFPLVGIAPATSADGFERLREWLDRGYAGEMAYLEQKAEHRRHPSSVLPEVRSVVMVGMTYAEESTRPKGREANGPVTRGRVARYAQGPDYHPLMWQKLDSLLQWLQIAVPGCQGRGVVDSAPLLERDFARRAGLGWFGKNTMLINKQTGSLFFLGALLVDVDLKTDAPHFEQHCGTCTACIDACPTRALVAPGWLDARRCISYLTIELRSPIPEELRADVGDWLFGCDICQEVCPWNFRSRPAEYPRNGELQSFDPLDLLSLTDDEFRQRFRGTAIWRTKRRGMLRNAAIVLGNIGDATALPTLRRALDDPEALIRDAAIWAIEQINQRANGGRDMPVMSAATAAGWQE